MPDRRESFADEMHPRDETCGRVCRAFLVAAMCATLGGCGYGVKAASTEPVPAVYAYPGGGPVHFVPVLPDPAGTHGGTARPVMAGDVLRIDVFRADEFDRTVQVDGTGFVSLPLLPPVEVAGIGVRELETRLESLWSDYLQAPDVAVFVEESAGGSVTVDGEVRRAGVYPVRAAMSLTRAVALAGGLREIADPGKVYVHRELNGKRFVANVDLAAVREGRAADPAIYAGDGVVVFASSGRVAFRNLKEALGLASSGATLAVLP